MTPIESDPRFLAAVEQLNAGEFFEASEGFEDLFFEAVRDEVPFARVFLQVSVGLFHAECRQRRPAIERLEQGLRAIDMVTNDRGYDLGRLAQEVRGVTDALRSQSRFDWPKVGRR
jgi:predicted metal-dependent hydrolase